MEEKPNSIVSLFVFVCESLILSSKLFNLCATNKKAIRQFDLNGERILWCVYK